MHRRKDAYSSKKKKSVGGSFALGGARAAAAKAARADSTTASSVPSYFPKDIEAARNKLNARSRAPSVSLEFSQ